LSRFPPGHRRNRSSACREVDTNTMRLILRTRITPVSWIMAALLGWFVSSSCLVCRTPPRLVPSLTAPTNTRCTRSCTVLSASTHCRQSELLPSVHNHSRVDDRCGGVRQDNPAPPRERAASVQPGVRKTVARTRSVWQKCPRSRSQCKQRGTACQAASYPILGKFLLKTCCFSNSALASMEPL
jgi:hypothetical protein